MSKKMDNQNTRLTEKQRAFIHEVAEMMETNSSSVVRMFINVFQKAGLSITVEILKMLGQELHKKENQPSKRERYD